VSIIEDAGSPIHPIRDLCCSRTEATAIRACQERTASSVGVRPECRSSAAETVSYYLASDYPTLREAAGKTTKPGRRHSLMILVLTPRLFALPRLGSDTHFQPREQLGLSDTRAAPSAIRRQGRHPEVRIPTPPVLGELGLTSSIFDQASDQHPCAVGPSS